ncbi:MAG: hypothetical protein E7186_03570 [Erysipelotrichaceae bacterium]|nr:hypothetical protein [Erysipelotrichaceae bacterium]
MSETDRKIYQDAYCGLCNRLHVNYGNLGRNTLSYDLTFITLLLSSVYKPEIKSGKERCLIHPLKLHDYTYSEITDYCADMNILLSYYHFLDDYHDDDNRTALRISGKLKPEFEKICARYLEKTAFIAECLESISEMEKHNVLNPDLPANQFGQLMTSLLDYREASFSKSLQETGYHLGRFIYLMDAYMDFKDDLKKERYNPLLLLRREDVPDILENIMAQCTLAYECLPVTDYKTILDNVLYSGVWTRYNTGKDKK